MKKLLNKNKLLIISYLFILPVVIYRIWFVRFDILSNGDWGFLFKESQLTFFSLPYIWINNSFGSVFISASSYFSVLFLGIFGFIGDFSTSERLVYFWPAVIFSSAGSFVLLRKFFNNNVAAIVGSFVFSYNTYFIIGRTGHLTLMVAFALAPLVLYFFIRTLEEKKAKLAVATGIISFICASYEFRAFYIIVFILLLYFVYYSLFIDRLSWKSFFKNAKFALSPMALVFLTNLYWVLGLSQTGSIVSNEIFNRGLFGNSYMNILRSISIFHPFWTGARFETFIVQPIPSYFFITPIVAFLGLVMNKKNKNVLFFGLISLLGIFLSKQVGEPFPGVYPWLFENFPGFNAFREASKFYFLTALGYSVLIGAFIAWLWENWNKKRWQIYGKYFLTFLVSFIFLWNTKSIITGEIGTLFVPRHVPSDYLVLKDFILKQPEYFRTFWVPRDSRWGIYTNEKPKVSDVSVIGSNWKNLFENYNEDERMIQERIANVFDVSFANNLFDNSAIKYVIVPLQDKANDDDFYVSYGGKDDPNIREWYISKLDKVEWLKKIDIGTRELVVYENENFRPHIYITKGEESIRSVVPFEKVEFEHRNPTEYKVSLKNVSGPVYLNFSESFHPDWKLRVGEFGWFDVLMEKNYFLPDSNHLKNKANLNSFRLEPEFIKENYPNSHTENTDGSINVELTLYFKPQSYFYFGLIISVTTLLTCLGYLGWDLVKRKKNEKNI